MSTLAIVVLIISVLAIVYAVGYVCYNQGEYAGRNDGYKVGYTEGQVSANLEAKWLAREAINKGLLDDACAQLFTELMGEEGLILCPHCMDRAIGKDESICKKCFFELQADAVYGLPINHLDEWKEWVDFGQDDEHTTRVADSDIPL